MLFPRERKFSKLYALQNEINPQGQMVSLCFSFRKSRNQLAKSCMNIVKELFGAKKILEEIKTTFLFLIPKKIGVDSPEQFGPINLCNLIYKIISKVLTLILLRNLPNLIFEQQNGFILGRKILNSIIFVPKNVHFYLCLINRDLL